MRIHWMAAAAAGVLLTLACGGGEKAAPAAEAPTYDSPPPLPGTSAVVQAFATGAVADVGVKECDDYLKQYTECVSSRVPEQVRTAMIAARGPVTGPVEGRRGHAGRPGRARAVLHPGASGREGIAPSVRVYLVTAA